MRILVLHSGALGDFIVALPVVAGLRELYADAWLEVLARGGYACLADGIADKTGSIDAAGLHHFFTPGGCAHAEPAGPPSHYISSFDLVISWLGDDFARRIAPLAAEVVSVPPAPPRGEHASVHIFRCVPQLRGMACGPARIHIADAEVANAAELLAGRGLDAEKPIVAVHPGSGGRGKCWPAGHFAQLIRGLRRAGMQAVLVAGEADAGAVGAVQGALAGEEAPVLHELPVRTLAAVLRVAGRYVGNDSGVSHLAAAAGAACTVVFGPTDPAVWAPRGGTVRVVAADLPCRPCRQTSPACPYALQCLSEVKPEAVLAGICG